MPVRRGRPAGARPRGRQLLRRDRAGRVLHAEHRARHRLHQRPAAAGPQLLLPRHPAQAARQPELHPPADQRAQVPVRALPAGRPHGDGQPAGPGQLRAELLAGAEGGPREDPAAGFRTYPGGRRPGAKRRLRPESFADHYSQARQFYISQTDGRAAAHRRRVHLRAEQVRPGAIRTADGGRPAQHRRGPGRRRWPTASACASCRTPRRPAREPRTRPAAVAGAEHPRATARTASPAARSASWSPTASTPAAARGPAGRPPSEAQVNVELVAPDGRRRRRQRRQLGRRPTRRSTAARRCSTTPSSCSPPSDGARRAGRPARGARLRRRRLRALQVHRLRRRRRAAVRGSRAGRPDRRRLRRPRPDLGCRLHRPLRRAAVLAAPGQHRRKGGRRPGLTGGARDRTDLARARGHGACHFGSARGAPAIV